jgi:hypothetical protein
MSITSIKQNAQNIIEAYTSYSQSKDKVKSEKLKKYILSLSSTISQKIKQEMQNVS